MIAQDESQLQHGNPPCGKVVGGEWHCLECGDCGPDPDSQIYEWEETYASPSPGDDSWRKDYSK